MTRITHQAHKRDHTTLLTTIPGVGPYGSLMIYAEIGDIHRFPTPKHLISYAGLCPRHPPIRGHRTQPEKQCGQQISQMDPLRMLRTGSHARPKNPRLLLQHQTQKRIQNSTTSHRTKTPHHHLAHTHQQRTLSPLTVHTVTWTQWGKGTPTGKLGHRHSPIVYLVCW